MLNYSVFLWDLGRAGSLLVIGTLSSSRVMGLTLTDPLAFFEVLLAAKSFKQSLLISALIIVLTYSIVGKAFCSWVCPVGLFIEILNSQREAKRQKQYYSSLPVVLLLSLLAGIPVFQMLSPISIIYRILLFGFGLEGLILVFIALLELLGFNRGWCRIFCPVGVFYALIARFSPLKIHCNKEKCLACLKCVRACNYTSESLKELVKGAAEYSTSPLCTRCGQCIDACPTNALKFTWKRHASATDSGPLKSMLPLIGHEAAAGAEISRRQMLQGTGILALVGLVSTPVKFLEKVTPKVLRPPGAQKEGEFLAKCIRCGKCIEVCPDKTLLSAHISQGLNVGTPYFIPRQTPCSLCLKCPEVCPTGALTPLDMRQVKIGVAEIEKDRCYAYQGDVCRSCYNNCPLIDEAIYMKEFQYPEVDPAICTGCGICEYVCVMDKPAIKIKLVN